ncbi:XdhC family aldehyde oxidoreductase maturation factor [Desulfocurvus sp. DL9XJH121]
MRELLHEIRRMLEHGQDLALATIVESSGSTPRASGAKMAVRRDGTILGTVGGGLPEALARDAALDLFKAGNRAARLLTQDLSNELAADSDMICGGRVTLLLEHLDADAEGPALRDLDEGLIRGRGGVLITVLDSLTEDGGQVVERLFLPQDGPAPQTPALAELADEARSTGLTALRHQDGITLLAEPFAPRPTVFVFGAGHVSRPTMQIAHIAGFCTVVLDDRPEFANRERFPLADRVLVADDLATCLQGLDIGPSSALVIVTRGHVHDKTVLAQALATRAGYVGMIGSRRKRDAIYDALRGEGFTDADIARCHSPIGLDIGARTPEEIAVSIVAELVAWRTAAEAGEGA